VNHVLPRPRTERHRWRVVRGIRSAPTVRISPLRTADSGTCERTEHIDEQRPVW